MVRLRSEVDTKKLIYINTFGTPYASPGSCGVYEMEQGDREVRGEGEKRAMGQWVKGAMG